MPRQIAGSDVPRPGAISKSEDGLIANIEIVNRQSFVKVDCQRLSEVIGQIARDAGFSQASVAVAVIDNPEIQRLHARHLQLDEPTDVLSFVLAAEGEVLEGEIAVSGEMAATRAVEFQWSGEDELLLYAVHGALHLVGFDDTSESLRSTMREQERHYLQRYGLSPRYADVDTDEQQPEDHSRPAACQEGSSR